MKSLLLFLALALAPCALASPVPKASGESVTVYWQSLRGEARPVLWKRGMTLNEAIAHAAGSPARDWQQAWRLRETFWSRIFHGTKTVSVLAIRRTENRARPTSLQPGDIVCVDCEPIL